MTEEKFTDKTKNTEPTTIQYNTRKEDSSPKEGLDTFEQNQERTDTIEDPFQTEIEKEYQTEQEAASSTELDSSDTEEDMMYSSSSLTFTAWRRNRLFDGLKPKQVTYFKLAALLIYSLAYLSVVSFFNTGTSFQSAYYFPIVAGTLVIVEGLCYSTGWTYQRLKESGTNLVEPITFLTLSLLQALTISHFSGVVKHPVISTFGFFQGIALHLTTILYLAARTGWLAQGRLGVLVWYDWLKTLGINGLTYFSLMIQVLFLKQEETTNKDKTVQTTLFKRLGFIIGSLVVASILVFFAWSQLSVVSEKFATITQNFGHELAKLLKNSSAVWQKVNIGEIVSYMFLALPLSFWLYSMIVGNLLGDRTNKLSYDKFQESLKPLRIFPSYTAYIIIGSLCFIYSLFVASALSELGTLTSAAIAPHQASTAAVAGFWQLVRVALLNFAVLGSFYLLSARPLWDKLTSRLALTLLFGFSTSFALLAAWKLFGIYIALYGLTELRLLSGWFILVLLVWCLLTLIRLYKPIQAIRIGIFYALISFTISSYLYYLLLI